MELADAPTDRIDYAESVVKILERSDNNIVGEGKFFLRGGDFSVDGNAYRA